MASITKSPADPMIVEVLRATVKPEDLLIVKLADGVSQQDQDRLRERLALALNCTCVVVPAWALEGVEIIGNAEHHQAP